jgi:hypothetical protein
MLCNRIIPRSSSFYYSAAEAEGRARGGGGGAEWAFATSGEAGEGGRRQLQQKCCLIFTPANANATILSFLTGEQPAIGNDK